MALAVSAASALAISVPVALAASARTWAYPGPIFIQDLSRVAKNAVVGNLITMIGKTIGDKSVIEVGNEIMATR